ncbi:Protein phosphatase 1 regulatory subunit 3A [Exaiptasia diaphana]|nr:Protein phosphatase 1 regulatory subunit 3A [Exaiptasia diaphana]
MFCSNHAILTFCKKNNPMASPSRSLSCNSCSTGRTVKFADFFGKRLEYVKTITPNSSFEDFSSLEVYGDQERRKPLNFNRNIELRENCSEWKEAELPKAPKWSKPKENSVEFLCRYLPQPLFRTDFFQRFEKSSVLLENIFVSSSRNVLIGVIRVKNLAYKKEVFVRHTFNEWKEHKDEKAEFAYQCCDGRADKFLFQLRIHRSDSQQNRGAVQFAICCKMNIFEFWDNNNGSNYRAEYSTIL